jgi:iron complex outermembrane receptor protein
MLKALWGVVIPLLVLAIPAVASPPEDTPESRPEAGQEAEAWDGEAESDEREAKPVFEEAIVVTAQRREQNLQDVPIAISLITSKETKDTRLQRLTEIVKFVPNADIKDALPGFSQVITIRGVGQNDFGFLNSSSVGVYVDEVHLASPGQFGFMAFDLERVEVLRGPQGTLYGRNTTGGAVNIQTVRPSQERNAYLNVGLGNFEFTELEGAVGGSLGGNWSARLSGRFERQGESFHFNRMTDADFGSTETAAIRGQLAYTRGDLDLNLSVSYVNSEGAHVPYEQKGLLDRSSVEAILSDPEQGLPIFAAFNAPWCEATAAGSFDQQHCVNVHGYSDTDGDPRSHDAHTTDGLLDIEQYGAALAIDWDFGSGMTLTSITGYQHFNNVRTEDQSGPLVLFAPRIHGWIDQFSQEFRLAGGSRTVHWIGGLFYSFDSAHERATDAMDDFFYTRLFSLDDQETRSYAAFANVDWAFSDRWAVNGGLRLTREERDKIAESTDLNPFQSSLLLDLFYGIDPTTSGAVTYAATDDALDHSDVSGKLGLDFRPSDDWLLYLSASSGFKSGGWITGIVFEQHELEPFEPEKILAYELGFKGTVGRNLLNGAVFYYDYENIQTFIQSSIGFRLGNIDGAKSVGGEIELISRPTANLALRAGVGYLDTEMSSFMGTEGLVPEGNQLPNAPKWNFNGLVRYDMPVSEGFSLALQTDFKYQSEMFRNAENDPLTATDAHFLVNGRIALTPRNRRWEVALWGKNLTDEDFVVSGFNVPILGIVTHIYNPPRTFGLSFGWIL